MRAFVKMRELMMAHKGLFEKLRELEARIGHHDKQLAAVFDAIRQLMAPPGGSDQSIGFKVKD